MRSVWRCGAAALLLMASYAPVYVAVADTPGQSTPVLSTKDFIGRVVGDTEDGWGYPRPYLVLFSGKTHSDCGPVSAAVEPYYCPVDRKVYLDPAFLGDWSRRYGPPGDFAQAYLIVHEISHHVQNMLGKMPQKDPALSGKEEERQTNPLHVRSALLADCYTGVWVHFVQKRGMLDPGDLEEGLPAAQAVGDASKHGDAAQRMRWFKRGLATGDPRQCDTFVAEL